MRLSSGMVQPAAAVAQVRCDFSLRRHGTGVPLPRIAHQRSQLGLPACPIFPIPRRGLGAVRHRVPDARL